MGIVSKIFYTTSCLTIFAGTAYVAAVTLAPPPSYTVSNRDRLARYNALAEQNVYEKKTRSQEFYLGLTRWRRSMLREEGLLHGRVLEVGAGCGGNVPYYPSHYFTEESAVQQLLLHSTPSDEVTSKSASHVKGAAFSTNATSNSEYNAGAMKGLSIAEATHALQVMEKAGMCDEIVLCDRAPNMVESCVQRVRSRLGYTPYRYPDYDITRIVTALRAHPSESGTSAVVKRKVVHADGSVAAVYASPLQDDQERTHFLATHTGTETDHTTSEVNTSKKETDAEVAVPLLPDCAAGDHLPLLSAEGERELRRRAAEIATRQSFRTAMIATLRSIVTTNNNSSGDVDDTQRSPQNETTAQHTQSITSTAAALPAPPKAWLTAAAVKTPHTSTSDTSATKSEGSEVASCGLQPQPLYSVANYAAEQLPFADNSFDTVVDMFGLCSYDDPVRALRELSRVCKPSGRLLLLEHGKGSAARVNTHLDKWAPRHAKSWGCWWNRDIRRIIRLSGLTVEKWKSKHFGTSHYIIARPYKTMDEWDDYARQQHRNKTTTPVARAARQ